MSGERERLTQDETTIKAALDLGLQAWRTTGSRERFLEANAALARLLSRVAALEEALARAAYCAEHLMQMIDQETWRAHGADDGQGHYEGDYRAAQMIEEIKLWAVLAGVPATDTAAREAEQAFLAATVEVWQEIDRLSAAPGGYTGLAASTDLRKRERAAWEAYKPFLVPATDTESSE